jgi:uncharacterized protein YbjT (DUF2867 family)
MRVVIAGGHGKIARRLSRILSDHGNTVVGLIRDPSQSGDLDAAGAEPVVLSLEEASTREVAETLRAADAVIFAAGAGPGSGAARKYTVDLGGSVLLADAAESAGIRRFVQISTMGAGRPPAADADDVWKAYIDAKTQAEDDLRRRDLDWTIVRPGRLTDEPGTGQVTLQAPSIDPGAVPRDDVAAVVAEILDRPETSGLTLELIAGEMPVRAAVAVVAGTRQ